MGMLMKWLQDLECLLPTWPWEYLQRRLNMIREQHGDPHGPLQRPNSILQVAVYPRKSNKGEEGQSKSKAQQIEYLLDDADFKGYSRDNIIIYDEPEGQKGDWYWRDAEGRNPGPWRPELTRMMNDIADGKIDVVMCWRSDRLTRDSGVGDAIAKELRKHGTRLICAGRDMAIDTSSGLYDFNVESASNRRWRDQISEDIIRDKQHKMRMGMFVRDPSCFGIRSKGKRTQAVEPIWSELEIVNRIFRLFVLGEGERGPMGINAVANLLMDEGVVLAVGAKGHRSKDPTRIHTSQVKTILTNCEYIGKFRYKQNEYDCKALLFPARDGNANLETAVPIALYEAAQEKLKLTDRPGKRSAYSEHLLSGLVVCAYCGRPLHVHYEPKRSNGESSRWYICSNRKPPRYCKPYGMRMIQEDVFDEWVLRELAPLLILEMESSRSAAGRDADAQALEELQRKISELLKKETQSLRDMVGVFDKDQIARVAGDFRSEREQMERRAAEIRVRLDRHADLPDLSPEALADMPNSAIKDALRRAVQWIAVGKEGLVVFTSFGTYIGATFDEIPKGTYYTSGTRTGIATPTPASVLRCLTWLPSPETFIKGRRASMGRRADKLRDEEILPGVGELGEPVSTDASIELIIEEISLSD